ncbi:MAG TPA: FMN-binding negative transcriptional regulator [Pseudoxanthomonas sp.]|nr:FMN-binding negative transcriptional regulator [Pseudoxanthomonas sp.]
MYAPRAFVETDLAALDWLLARDAFVTLVTVADGRPWATHLPVLYRRHSAEVLLEGHWARPNPQASHRGEALVIVHGPHAYVSPGWYPDKEENARVPTWNYAAAHLHGSLQAFEDAESLAGVVDRLGQRFEAEVGSDWRFERGREDHAAQLRGIVGFRFVPERIELKFKLSQNHPEANVRGAMAGLRALPGERNAEVAGLMRDRLQRRLAAEGAHGA